MWNFAGLADWTVATDWTPNGVPNSTGTNVCITNGTGVVTLTTTQAAGNLQIGAGNGLNITSGTLYAGGSIQNDGAFTSSSFMILASDVTLSGAGTLTLAGGQIGTNSNGYTLTNQSTIQGSGVIGSNVGASYQNLNFSNSGIVNANSSGNVLSIQGSGGAISNTGLLEATGGGTLNLAPSVAIVNVGGTIAANAGTVNVAQTIQGGTLTTLNGGVLQTAGTAALDGASFGAITLSSGSTYTAASGLTSVTGSLILGTGAGSTLALSGQLRLVGDTTLSGPGVVLMSGGEIGADSNGHTLTNNLTISGSGLIGSNNGALYQSLGLVNNGTVNASVSGQTLYVQGTGAIVNAGVLEATNGATLTLNTQAAVQNSGGSIVADGVGNTVTLLNETVTGGVLTATNGALMQSAGSTTLDATSLGAITLSNGSTYTAGAGTLTSTTGLLKLGTGVASTLALSGQLRLIGDTTLSGPGVVSMSGGEIGTNGNGYTLTNNLTISGSGLIGSNNGALYQSLSLANNGTINANVSGQTLSVQGAGGSIVNSGILEATNGGILTLATVSPIGNAGSVIQAVGSGSTVNLAGQTVQGGTLTTSAAGVMQTAGNARLDGTTAGAITLSDGSTYGAGASTITSTNGTLLLGTGAGSTLALSGQLRLVGDLTLSGPGLVSMSGGEIGTDSNGYTLTNNLTISGSGLIGSNNGALFQNLSLANNGTINANLAGQTLRVQGTGGSIVNSGILEATGGGILTLATQTPINNAAGVIKAVGAGSTVNLAGQTVQGGTLTTSAGGVMQTAVGATLDGISAGAITLSDGSTYTSAAGALTNTTGTLILGGGAGSTLALGGQLRLIGDTTLSGSGTLSMSGGEIGTDSNGYTLTNNLTINGSGLIGSNNGVLFQNLNVVNNGTINANSAGNTLTIGGTGSLSGTGTLQVAGGTLALALGSDASQGKLVIGAAGSLATNTHNLVIGNDYTNAQAGTGNGFDRRAGIAGPGLILAGGNAAQAIVGNTVSNGSTADATLTINNVRVGSTTYNYAIANTGTTGPSLRGAIQTNVNGANLTDARLSGSGVTAGNYNTGAPGSTTGNLGVVFTTATAGAIAPLSGQVLNLTSNFDNIADQKLHIVIGNNAAAYSAATGNAASPVQVANQRISGTNTATVTVANTTPSSAYSEDLNASVSAQSGSATGSGAIAGRLAGTNNTGTGAITVAVDTSSAGAKTGGVTLAYQTAGTVNGVSNGLGTANVGTQVVTVNGNVYQAAAGSLQTTALNFGTVQVGQSVSQNLVVRNTATGPAGFVEDLNASFGASTGSSASLISGSGSLNGIVAGSNSGVANGTMTVSVNTASAGAVSGGINVNYATAGAVGGISNGLGTASAGSQNFGVSGTIQTTVNVINQASPLINTPAISLGAVRVGDAAPTANVSITNQSTTAPQAALNASISSNGAPVTAGGSFNLLAPGSTSANQLSVGLNTATAGNFTGANAGSATVALVSDASNVGNCAPNCQLTLASQQVSVSGKVYAPAVAQVNSMIVDFGIVHAGDVVATKGLSVTNGAASTALNDTLVGTFSGASGGPFTATGSLPGIGAQATDATSLRAGLNAGSAGVFTGTATATFGSHDADLSDRSLGSTSITLKAQVNNYAQASFTQTAGTGMLSHAGQTYTLDLGDLTLGNGGLSDTLALLNSVLGPADLLSGTFAVTSADAAFQLSGFGPVSGLAAGAGQGGLVVSFASGVLGSYDETIVFHGVGSNASGYSGAIGDTTLVLHGDVIGVTPVPEPETYALMLAGLFALGATARSRRRSATSS